MNSPNLPLITALISPAETTSEIISAINKMVEQDFSRQERAKYQEARTRYIQIRLSEVSTAADDDQGAVGGGGCPVNDELAVVQKQSSGEDELQDSVFYSTSPCHVFRETTV